MSDKHAGYEVDGQRVMYPSHLKILCRACELFPKVVSEPGV